MESLWPNVDYVALTLLPAAVLALVLHVVSIALMARENQRRIRKEENSL